MILDSICCILNLLTAGLVVRAGVGAGVSVGMGGVHVGAVGTEGVGVYDVSAGVGADVDVGVGGLEGSGGARPLGA